MSTTRRISLTFTILGSIIALALAAGNTSWLLRFDRPAPGDPPTAVNMHRVDTLAVEAAGAAVNIGFDDVAVPLLDFSATGSARHWELYIDRATLHLRSNSAACIGWCPNGEAFVTLMLPEHLEGALAGEIDLMGGTLDLAGEFTHLGVEVTGGRLTFDGSAEHFGAEIAGGSATITLVGAAPNTVEMEVVAGDASLSLPDVPYALHTEGTVENLLRTDPNSDSRIEIEVYGGSVVLRPNPEDH